MSNENVKFALRFDLLINVRREDLKVFLRMSVLKETLKHLVLWRVQELPLFSFFFRRGNNCALEQLIDAVEDLSLIHI